MGKGKKKGKGKKGKSKKDKKRKDKKKSKKGSKKEKKSKSKSPSNKESKTSVSQSSPEVKNEMQSNVCKSPQCNIPATVSATSCSRPVTEPTVNVYPQKPPIVIPTSDQPQIIEIVPSKSCECPEEIRSAYVLPQPSCIPPQSCQPHPPQPHPPQVYIPYNFPPRCPVQSGCGAQFVRPKPPQWPGTYSRGTFPYEQMNAIPPRGHVTWSQYPFRPGERFRTNVTVLSAAESSNVRGIPHFNISQHATPSTKKKSYNYADTGTESHRNKPKRPSKIFEGITEKNYEKDIRGSTRKHGYEKRKPSFKKSESESALQDELSDSSSFSAIFAPTSVPSLASVSPSVTNFPSVRVKPAPQYLWWNPPPVTMAPGWMPPHYMSPEAPTMMSNPYQPSHREYNPQDSEWNSSQDAPPAYKAPEIIWMVPSEPPPQDPQPFWQRTDPMKPRIYVYAPRPFQDFESPSEYVGTIEESGSMEDMYSNSISEEYDQSDMLRSSSWPQVIPSPEQSNHYQDNMRQRVKFAPSRANCLSSLRTLERATSWPRTAVLRNTKRYIYPENGPHTSLSMFDEEWQNQEMAFNFNHQVRPNVVRERRYDLSSSQSEYRPQNSEIFAGGHSRVYHTPQRHFQTPQLGLRCSGESRQWQPTISQRPNYSRRQGGSFQCSTIPGRGCGPIPSYIPHASQSQPHVQRGNLPQFLSRVPEGQPMQNYSDYTPSLNTRRVAHFPWVNARNTQVMMFTDMDDKQRIENSEHSAAKEHLMHDVDIFNNGNENVPHSYKVESNAPLNQAFKHSNGLSISEVDVNKTQITSKSHDPHLSQARAEDTGNCEILLRLPQSVTVSRNIEVKVSRDDHSELLPKVKQLPQHYEQGNILPPHQETYQSTNTLRKPMISESDPNGSVIHGVQMPSYTGTSLNTNKPLLNENEMSGGSSEFQNPIASQFQTSIVDNSMNTNTHHMMNQHASEASGTLGSIELQSYACLSPPQYTNIIENRYPPPENITNSDSISQKDSIMFQRSIEPLIEETTSMSNASTRTKMLSASTMAKMSNVSVVTKNISTNCVICPRKRKIENASTQEKPTITSRDSTNIQSSFLEDCRTSCGNCYASSRRQCSNQRTKNSRCVYKCLNSNIRPIELYPHQGLTQTKHENNSNSCASFLSGRRVPSESFTTGNGMPVISTGHVGKMMVNDRSNLSRSSNASNSFLTDPLLRSTTMYSGIPHHSTSRTNPSHEAHYSDVYSSTMKTFNKTLPDSIFCPNISNGNKTTADNLPFALYNEVNFNGRNQMLNGHQRPPGCGSINVTPVTREGSEGKQELRASKLPHKLRVNITPRNPREGEHNDSSNVVSQDCLNRNVSELANSMLDQEADWSHQSHSSTGVPIDDQNPSNVHTDDDSSPTEQASLNINPSQVSSPSYVIQNNLIAYAMSNDNKCGVSSLEVQKYEKVIKQTSSQFANEVSQDKTTSVSFFNGLSMSDVPHAISGCSLNEISCGTIIYDSNKCAVKPILETEESQVNSYGETKTVSDKCSHQRPKDVMNGTYKYVTDPTCQMLGTSQDQHQYSSPETFQYPHCLSSNSDSVIMARTTNCSLSQDQIYRTNPYQLHYPSKWPMEYFLPLSSRCPEKHGISGEYEHSSTLQAEEIDAPNLNLSSKLYETRLPNGNYNKLLVSSDKSSITSDRAPTKTRCLECNRSKYEDNPIETSATQIHSSSNQMTTDATERKLVDKHVLLPTSGESSFRKSHDHELSSKTSAKLVSTTASSSSEQKLKPPESAAHKSYEVIPPTFGHVSSIETLGDDNIELPETYGETLKYTELMGDCEDNEQTNSSSGGIFRTNTTDDEELDLSSSDVMSSCSASKGENQIKPFENQCPFLSSCEGRKIDLSKIPQLHCINKISKPRVQNRKSESLDEEYSVLKTMQYLIKPPALPLEDTAQSCISSNDTVMQGASHQRMEISPADITHGFLARSQRPFDKKSMLCVRSRSHTTANPETNKPLTARNALSENDALRDK